MLQEADSAFIAEPGLGFVVDDDGSLYIADDFQSRFARFDSAGRLAQVYGTAGTGPGEFKGFERFTFVRDTIVLQAAGSRVKAFNRISGAFLGEFPHSRAFWSGYAVQGDTIYIPLFNYGQTQGVFRVSWRALLGRLRGESEPVVRANFIDFPPEYRLYPSLQDFSNVSLAVWSDTILAGYAGVPYLVSYRLDGLPIDTIGIPWSARRGFRPGWLEPFSRRGPPPTFQEEVAALSYLNGLWRMSDGRFLLWHQDNTANPLGTNPPLTGKAWLSVLSADRTRACVDAPLEFPASGWPNLAFFHDTLYAVMQVIGRDSTTARTELRKYRVNTDHCDWLPTD